MERVGLFEAFLSVKPNSVEPLWRMIGSYSKVVNSAKILGIVLNKNVHKNASFVIYVFGIRKRFFFKFLSFFLSQSSYYSSNFFLGKLQFLKTKYYMFLIVMRHFLIITLLFYIHMSPSEDLFRRTFTFFLKCSRNEKS